MTKADQIIRITRNCTEDCDCLLWQLTVNKAGAPIARGSVRREYWTLINGPIPEGKVPHPTCGRKNCLSHLKLFTLSRIIKTALDRPDTRIKRSIAARNNVPRKLSPDQVQALRAATGTQRAKAKQFGISQGMVSRIERHLNWCDAVQANPFAGLGARA